MKIVIDFVNGPRDGETLEADIGTISVSEVDGILKQIDGQGPEARYWCPSEYALNALRNYPADEIDQAASLGCRFPGHFYELAERKVTVESERLRLVHIGPAE